MFLSMVSRDEWRALPPLADIPLVTHPVENVIYQHSLDVPVCESDQECTKAVQDMQKKDMEEGKPDIIYNFLIGGNGKVYEGRGWYNQSDVHMYPEYNGNRIDIAYIGNFTNNIPGHDMIVTTERIMNFAVDLDFVKPNFLERQIVQRKEEDKAKAQEKHKVNIM
ncbi:peptidoglycan-recognition protein 1-like isoform X1 [Macrosteles quadrilineatus]|uniref:peptidoglycan-recognition protein 1-like isoform X1 n=1 Tax=Macrosteles quadrilineatus TaxID=74068 RepID=UPI0023E24DB9|nr:peptidoglycan-recognition protein 1-like isoform X1 [Macrosteles quadrilineatus]XP_054264168.1 peptidoglycan-recognition protein 1-like isoform X1 [Macrosteles quadrilineatus]